MNNFPLSFLLFPSALATFAFILVSTAEPLVLLFLCLECSTDTHHRPGYFSSFRLWFRWDLHREDFPAVLDSPCHAHIPLLPPPVKLYPVSLFVFLIRIVGNKSTLVYWVYVSTTGMWTMQEQELSLRHSVSST